MIKSLVALLVCLVITTQATIAQPNGIQKSTNHAKSSLVTRLRKHQKEDPNFENNPIKKKLDAARSNITGNTPMGILIFTRFNCAFRKYFIYRFFIYKYKVILNIIS